MLAYKRELLVKTIINNEGDLFDIRVLQEDYIAHLVQSFAQAGLSKPVETFIDYLGEQEKGVRCCWVAFSGNQVVGYVTLVWHSEYLPFLDQAIPEIKDLNVFPMFRGKGIGSALLAVAEVEAATRSEIVGIGVGLYADYGAAQRLYIRRGYIPDGQGVTYSYQTVTPGSRVRLDDDLVLWFVKRYDDR